jgi:hypothetical protein
MLSREGELPSSRGVDLHPSEIMDNCAIICSDRYPDAEQLFKEPVTTLEYFGHGGEKAKTFSRRSARCGG